jgi:hypothetical protein
MKTQIELTPAQEKKIALMQHLNEDFFIIESEDGEVTIYEGNEEEQRELFREDIEGTEEAEIDANFEIFCINNCTEVEEYDEDDYNNDYLVLTDEEADEKAKEYIIDSLWAFNATFIASEIDIDEDVINAIQDNGKCEGNNDTIYSLINKLGDIDSFVDSAISADGRGHFMSSYDGNENEENVNGTTYFIYRIN